MSVRSRLVGYGAVLIVAFGLGFGLADLAPDRSTPDAPESPRPSVDTAHDQHGRQSP
jgi:hypothetical protein